VNYYVADGTTQRGPFTEQELAGMALRPDTLVWHEGMPQWEPAGDVPALKPLLGQPASVPLPSLNRAPAESPDQNTGAAQPAAPLPMGYASPQYYPPPYDPATSKKVAAGVCGILLGGLGIHKFILGLTSGAVTMLCITLAGGLAGMGCACFFPPLFLLAFGPVVMHIIGLVEGIIYLTKSDQEFYQLYIVQRRQWF
jgi:TM2 domain-containing membrane protein YozV